VRSPDGFEPTPRGREILRELESLLPRMERLVAAAAFDPAQEAARFRLSGPDNVCTVLAPRLCRRLASERLQVRFDFIPWQTGAADLLEHGGLDLALHIDDGLLPSHLHSERLYQEQWICAVAKESRFGERLLLKQYLGADHVTVTTLPGVQNIPDKQLAALGVERRSSIVLPYFGAALACLPGTELVLTLTSGMRAEVERDAGLRMAKAPAELRPFHFLMAWHPRLNSDPRHVWLRQAVRQAAV